LNTGVGDKQKLYIAWYVTPYQVSFLGTKPGHEYVDSISFLTGHSVKVEGKVCVCQLFLVVY